MNNFIKIIKKITANIITAAQDRIINQKLKNEYEKLPCDKLYYKAEDEKFITEFFKKIHTLVEEGDYKKIETFCKFFSEDKQINFERDSALSSFMQRNITKYIKKYSTDNKSVYLLLCTKLKYPQYINNRLIDCMVFFNQGNLFIESYDFFMDVQEKYLNKEAKRKFGKIEDIYNYVDRELHESVKIYIKDFTKHNNIKVLDFLFNVKNKQVPKEIFGGGMFGAFPFISHLNKDKDSPELTALNYLFEKINYNVDESYLRYVDEKNNLLCIKDYLYAKREKNILNAEINTTKTTKTNKNKI